MSAHILHVVTNVSHYSDPNEPTGLWLGELTHAWATFASKGYTQSLVSPQGGSVPLEPRSLKWPNLDATAKDWLEDETKMALLRNTSAPGDIDVDTVDAIYFTGGHAVMYDFTDSGPLHRLTAAVWAKGGVVSSVCHGYCGLLNVRLSPGSRDALAPVASHNVDQSEGQYLFAGRKITGFSWLEERLAGVQSKVPYNAEELAKTRGARYEKALVPFTSKVVVDGRLVTGQNPQSAKDTALKIVHVLESLKL